MTGRSTGTHSAVFSPEPGHFAVRGWLTRPACHRLLSSGVRALSTLLRPIEDRGPAFRPLLGRGFLDAGGDGPDVPRWIHHPSGAIAPELVLSGDEHLC